MYTGKITFSQNLPPCTIIEAGYLERLATVDVEPVGAHEVLLVEHGVVRAQEVEVLELNKGTRQ